MNLKALLPVSLFCVIFLLYTIYFVKVVNTTRELEPNAIAKTVKTAMEKKTIAPPKKGVLKAEKKIIVKAPVITSPEITQYVNFQWLNVREKPSLGSKILEKIYLNDAVSVLGTPNAIWTYAKTPSGLKGYVASRYLSASKTINTEEKALSSDWYDIPIISYHHITDEKDKFPLNMTLPVTNFLAQLDYLVANAITTLSFHDLKAIHEKNMSAPKKAVILTFDDGYDDQYAVAQHLNGKGLKGVFFVIPGRLGTPGYLDWNQVKKMRSWGMEIGSHGVQSADLTASTEFFIKDELERSKKMLEKELSVSIISFAYPAGKYNAKVVDFAKKAGYSFARTINSGSQYKEAQFLKLPTLRVFPPAGAKQFKVWLE